MRGHNETNGSKASQVLATVLMGILLSLISSMAQAQSCARTVTANVVALDQPVLFNRLGASNINGKIYALARDVVVLNNDPEAGLFAGQPVDTNPATLGALAGNVMLRPDKRPRPLVLRIAAGDCLEVTFTNLLWAAANPFNPLGAPITVPINDQVFERNASFHVSGLEWFNGPQDDGSDVGGNVDSTVGPGGQKIYKLYAPEEGTFIVRDMAATVGSDANQGSSANLLFGQVIVEPKGARIYRSQTTEEELRLASMDTVHDSPTCGTRTLTAHGQPIIDYEALYPTVDCDAEDFVLRCDDLGTPPGVTGFCGDDGVTLPIVPYNIGGTGVPLGATAWINEGKAGLPVLNMITAGNEIAHSEINALIAGPGDDGSWRGVCGIGGGAPTADCPYPLERAGKRNPIIPNRVEPFRDFASAWHDEPATAQAFPGFYKVDPVFRYVLAGVKDGFMINYGSGGIGSEIIANRLGVGPMHDCLTCAYEEFFLTSFTVGDPAQLADVSANMGLEALGPADLPDPNDPAAVEAFLATWGPFLGTKASYVPYPADPANVHHSYTGDFIKFRNIHVGKEQHVFHLHNHQWLYNPNDDNSNYLDAQGIGPGTGYTYEINFGGAGNRMKSSGDAIFHCHFYPHFAQGMWYMWRIHDVLETGTPLQATAVAPLLETGEPNPDFQTQTAAIETLGFHEQTWALENGTPLLVEANSRARALPDAEIVAGAPIPAVIPLPGKAMAPLPGDVRIVPNPLTKTASVVHATNPGGVVPVGSLADVVERDVHPGYPFWIAGIEDVVGQRPPTPPLDMVDAALATALSDGSSPVTKFIKTKGIAVPHETVADLFAFLRPDQAAGHDGGLPRTALQGYAAGGNTALNTVSPLDFSKVLGEAQAVFYPEEGTDIEQLAMAYHATREHPSYAVDMNGNDVSASFVLNGIRPAVGAPYHEPCIDDQGDRFDSITNVLGLPGVNFWGTDYGDFLNADNFTGEGTFDADSPRIYQGVNIQFDAVLNKAGYHYPQQRIITLWEDAVPVITKAQPPEPLVMRFNSFECGVFHHTNLVPEYYELDDYQVRTPTDIIGQHIHLPKWDLTTADGAANGWNYEDGTLSPGAVYERIHALNEFVTDPSCDEGGTIDPDPVTGLCDDGAGGFIDPPFHVLNGNAHAVAKGAVLMDPTFDVPADFAAGTAHALDHPYFGAQAPLGALQENWKGARTTTQRWFFDPVINYAGEDRGLGLIFTHDHYGPSTHQQVGLYATVLAQPAGSTWAHNETGEQLGCRTPGERPATYGAAGACRKDGGPVSWQAMILPSAVDTPFNKAGQIPPHREFYFEYSDFQHAYEAGIYVGADQDGVPIGGPVGDNRAGMAVVNLGNPANCSDPANAFRCAINPPARLQKVPVFPDLVEEIATTAPGGVPAVNNFCPQRPCPQAIDVQDPGMFVVNYRNEPVAMRVFDPNKFGPEQYKAVPEYIPGTQADGAAGDLAFALASVDENSNPIIRKFEVMDFGGASTLPPQNPVTGGFQVLNIQPKAGTSIYGTVFPAPINEFSALKGGDPFTPMVRTMAGDIVRIKMQAGGDEEEHTATVHGIKWLQGGSAFGGAPHTGWRNAQPAGISEQFTLKSPVIGVLGERGNSTDYVYSMDASQDGFWSGMWGLMRVYNSTQGRTLTYLPGSPWESTNNVAIKSDNFDGVCPAETIGKGRAQAKVPLNLREYSVTAVLANDILPHGVVAMPGTDPNLGGHEGAYPDHTKGSLVYNSRGGGANGEVLHDPTAIMYVRTEDMENPDDPTAGLIATAPVEPLILRANAGDCIAVTLRNRLLTQAMSGGQPVIDAAGAAVFLDNGSPLFVANPGGPFDCGGTLCAEVLATAVEFDQMPDMATYSELIGAVKRDRGAGDVGSTTFLTNLIKASPWVGIHAQLVEYDASRDNGIHAGNKRPETLVAPGGERTYKWYAGHLEASVEQGKGNKAEFVLEATPVEFGAANLQPADVIKQGMKSMVGQLVIEPAGSTWQESDGVTNLAVLEARAGEDPNGGGRKTRANVLVTKAGPDGTQFRDLSTVWTKGLTQYYGTTNQPVEHINGEGVGVPEDPQDDTGMAINYGIEPLWYRLGIAPNAAFGNAATLGSFGAQPQSDLFSNANANAAGADPQTPVFEVNAGMETRIRIGMPHGTNRGSTFALHGHLWQRDPYLAQNRDGFGFPLGGGSLVDGKWVPNAGIGSVEIGHNPMGFYMGGLESIWPSSHFDIRLPSAGGCANEEAGACAGKAGDYLFRDFGSIGSASGLWGILRVE